MTDDAGRRAGAPGNTGAAGPTADPATDPGLRPVPAGPAEAPLAVPPAAGPTSGPPVAGPVTGTAPAVQRSRSGVLWVGLILAALVLLVLLVFIIQNGDPVHIAFFALDGTLPTGVALLLAAIAGILLGAIPGSMRIMQLRRAARRRSR